MANRATRRPFKSGQRILFHTESALTLFKQWIDEDGRLKVYGHGSNHFGDKKDWPYYLYVTRTFDGWPIEGGDVVYLDSLVLRLNGTRRELVESAVVVNQPAETLRDWIAALTNEPREIVAEEEADDEIDRDEAEEVVEVEVLDSESKPVEIARITAKFAELFQELGSDVQLAIATLDSGDTALHLAAESEGSAVGLLLISRGADVSAVNNHGYTPLVEAAYHLNYDLAEALIANGADVNARNDEGNTPLEQSESRRMSQLLYRHGAVL